MKNPERKTSITYARDIREKYNSDKEMGNISNSIYDLTGGNIRKACLSLIDHKLSLSDKMIMKNFFDNKVDEELRSEVKNHDLDKYRPIIKFLKGENKQVNSSDTLELIALIVDFTPRPYNSYLKESQEPKKPKHDSLLINNITNNRTPFIEDDYETNQENKKGIIKILIENRKIVILFSLMIALVFAITSINQQRWMEWQENHYVEVEFDAEKLSNGTLKLYKEERIKKFNQITPDCNTDFFSSDGSENLWYGKDSNGELEYFTALGLHPETGVTLKKITPYMIEKYICETYND